MHDEIEWARAVFEGRRTEEVKGPTLASALSGHNVTWPEFQRWVSIIASNTFHLPDDAGVTRAVFLPLLDLINHGDKGDANADVDREGGSFVIRATRDIKPGDEVQGAGRGGGGGEAGAPPGCGGLPAAPPSVRPSLFLATANPPPSSHR